MKIFDIHAHIYPEQIAEKAVKNVGKFYGLPMSCPNGTADNLTKIAEEAGVVKIVVHSVATAPQQVFSINRFLAREAAKNSLLLPFATLHPDMDKETIREELKNIEGLNLHGIKLHPDCQGFPIDGKRSRKILDEMSGELPILFHTGDRRMLFSNPFRLQKIAKEYPHLTFIAAHFGGYSEWEQAEGYIGLDNVYFDTSSTLSFLNKSRALEIIREIGVERFMFGTDYPMWDYTGEIKRIKNLNLTEQEAEAIFFNNAAKFFGLEY